MTTLILLMPVLGWPELTWQLASKCFCGVFSAISLLWFLEFLSAIALIFLVMMDRALQLAMVLLNQTFNMKLMQIMLLIWVLFQTLTTLNWESCIQLVQHQSSFVVSFSFAPLWFVKAAVIHSYFADSKPVSITSSPVLKVSEMPIFSYWIGAEKRGSIACVAAFIICQSIFSSILTISGNINVCSFKLWNSPRISIASIVWKLWQHILQTAFKLIHGVGRYQGST